MTSLGHRAERILYAAMTEFIATGEPVGSRTLEKKYGLSLSAATIRNVLADLEEAGYLQQPHTSAGRVPTDLAFRFFIDTLMQVRDLAAEDITAIHDRFESMQPGTDLMRESGRILSELTGTAAVVMRTARDTSPLMQLRFVPTRPGELLAVIVLADGTVENRFLRLDAPISEADLVRVHGVLSDVLDGRTLGDLRDFFARRLEGERAQMDSLRRRAFELGQKAVEDAGERTAVVIEGRTRLFELPDFSDVEQVRKLMRLLDERETLVELLDRTLEARTAQVYVGSEVGEAASGALGVVATRYTEQGRVAGTIGVIGPARMDYPKVVPLVEATASAMSDALERPPRGRG